MMSFMLLVLFYWPIVQSNAWLLRTWEDSYKLADTAVLDMNMEEKIGIVRGAGSSPIRRCGAETTAISRLGIPPICFNDGPAGVRPGQLVTGFPAAINVASTFSRRLMFARGKALGEEFRGKGIHIIIGPSMDIMRNPKAGRGWESFGPDPYLTGEGAYETILGVQNVGVQACAKHLIANNQEHYRYALLANIDVRTLTEIYWYPFLRSIEAGVTCVMCGYTLLNGTYNCQDPALIGNSGLLRLNGFRGFVMSDWGATHGSANENANAGLDMEQPGNTLPIGGGVFSGLESDVASGLVGEDRLNQMVTRILASWYRLGQDEDYPPVNFDALHPDGSGPLNLNVSVRSDEHTLLALEIASASAVLLKNERITDTGEPDGTTIRGLPLARNINTIAVVGLDAKIPNLNCDDPLYMNRCNDGTMSIGYGSGANSLDFIIPPIDAIEDFAGASAIVTTSLSNDVTEGAAAAMEKDVALVFVNTISGELIDYEEVSGNRGDRNDLYPLNEGQSLVDAVAAVNDNTIVIVHSVGPISMPWSTHPNITAIIYAGAPGEQTGPSLVDVLYGNYNPSGRLPFSIADNEDDYGTSIVYNSSSSPVEIDYTEQLLLDYRYMESTGIEPRFEFGFGLSYTTFAYSDLSITASETSQNISFSVSNTGTFVGTDKPQLYLGYPPSAGEPSKVLRGFEEVLLEVGASSLVSMTLHERDISIWDTSSQAWVRPSGTFTVYVGASIKDIRLTETFESM